MGETQARFGNVVPRSVSGENSALGVLVPVLEVVTLTRLTVNYFAVVPSRGPGATERDYDGRRSLHVACRRGAIGSASDL